jgi:8-oxo-dGTP diphosphatase
LAGGAVVARADPSGGREVVVVHRSRYGDWTLPKGKVHSGESIPAAAVREVAEETGMMIRLATPLDTIHYDTTKGPKRVDYWVGETVDQGVPAAADEVDEIVWLPIRAAMTQLTYAHDHHLLQQFDDQPPTVPLLLVRHGKAMDRKDWTKKDAARPVASLGRRQARLLVPMLAAYGVQHLVSSTSCRCVSTLRPYAETIGVDIEQHSGLSEEEGSGHPKLVGRIISEVRAAVLAGRRPTALCVHRPVLPHILDALDLAPATLRTGEFLVAHLTLDGQVHAVERHRPQA